MLSLITGVGKRGQVGEAVAAALARRGDTVLLVSRSADDVLARADELQAQGFPAQGYACDLVDGRAVGDLVHRVRSDHGEHLDCLVNLAGGYARSGPLAASDPGLTGRLMEINFTTAYLTTRAFLPLVRAARGSIVYFASENVLEGAHTAATAAYTAAKSAVAALMRSVADEGREDGVRSNALAPGTIRTTANENAMGREAPFVEREDVAAVVEFLCSPASQGVSGQLIRLR